MSQEKVQKPRLSRIEQSVWTGPFIVSDNDAITFWKNLSSIRLFLIITFEVLI